MIECCKLVLVWRRFNIFRMFYYCVEQVLEYIMLMDKEEKECLLFYNWSDDIGGNYYFCIVIQGIHLWLHGCQAEMKSLKGGSGWGNIICVVFVYGN